MRIDQMHEEMVLHLAKDGSEILHSLTPGKVHLWHMLTGIETEAGELMGAIKKHVVYNQELDLENVIEELGDLEFYLQGVRTELEIERQDTLKHNIRKLAKRYPDSTYSDEAAKQRADKPAGE